MAISSFTSTEPRGVAVGAAMGVRTAMRLCASSEAPGEVVRMACGAHAFTRTSVCGRSGRGA